MKTARVVGCAFGAFGILLSLASCPNALQQIIARDTMPRYPVFILKQGTVELGSGTGSYDFGSVQMGTTREVEFIIENGGENTLTLSGDPLVAISGTDAAEFEITAMPATTLEPGATTTFAMAFSPFSVAAKSALLTISSNDEANAEYTVALTGTGTAAPLPEMSISRNSVTYDSGSTFDYGGAIVSTAMDITFSIDNTGQGDLNLTGTEKVAVSGTNAGDFTVLSPPSSPVPAGGSSTFTVQLDAALPGGKTAALTIANDDQDEGTYVVNITATVSAVPEPEINIKQGVDNLGNGTGTYGFGSVKMDGNDNAVSSWIEFTIENTGNANLNITNILFASGDTSDFDLVNTTTSPVPPSGSTAFSLRFDPLVSAAGSKSAVVQVNNNDSDEPTYAFTITGTAYTTPTLTTTTVTAITGTTATSGGNITADGYASVTVRGVCWSTSTNPDISLPTKTSNGSGTGSFASSITGLTGNTTYYVRAYATNAAGTAYGNEVSFKTDYAVRGPGQAGGIVFYDKGSYSGAPSWRYLEVAPVSTEATKPWGVLASNIPGAAGTAIGTGRQDTIDIVAVQGNTTTDYAAQVCDQLSYGGYSDWYLPSKDELNEIFQKLVQTTPALGDLANTYYWSSSEGTVDPANNAWEYLNVGAGSLLEISKDFDVFKVRAIRQF